MRVNNWVRLMLILAMNAESIVFNYGISRVDNVKIKKIKSRIKDYTLIIIIC